MINDAVDFINGIIARVCPHALDVRPSDGAIFFTGAKHKIARDSFLPFLPLLIYIGWFQMTHSLFFLDCS